jgi:hypothetical protein
VAHWQPDDLDTVEPLARQLAGIAHTHNQYPPAGILSSECFTLDARFSDWITRVNNHHESSGPVNPHALRHVLWAKVVLALWTYRSSVAGSLEEGAAGGYWALVAELRLSAVGISVGAEQVSSWLTIERVRFVSGIHAYAWQVAAVRLSGVVSPAAGPSTAICSAR